MPWSMKLIFFIVSLATTTVIANDDVMDNDSVYIKYFNQASGQWEYLGEQPWGTYCAAGGPTAKQTTFVVETNRECLDNDLKKTEGDRHDTSFPQKGLRIKYAGSTRYLSDYRYLYAATTGHMKYDQAISNSKQYFRNPRSSNPLQFFYGKPFELQDLYVWSHACVNVLSDASSYSGGDSMHWVEDPYERNIGSQHNCTFYFEPADTIDVWTIRNLTFVTKPQPQSSEVQVFSRTFCNSDDEEHDTTSYEETRQVAHGEKTCNTFSIKLKLDLKSGDKKVGGSLEAGYEYEHCTDSTQEESTKLTIPAQKVAPHTKFDYNIVQMKQTVDNVEFKAILAYTVKSGASKEQQISGTFAKVSYTQTSENIANVDHKVSRCDGLDLSPQFV